MKKKNVSINKICQCFEHPQKFAKMMQIWDGKYTNVEMQVKLAYWKITWDILK